MTFSDVGGFGNEEERRPVLGPSYLKRAGVRHSILVRRDVCLLGVCVQELIVNCDFYSS